MLGRHGSILAAMDVRQHALGTVFAISLGHNLQESSALAPTQPSEPARATARAHVSGHLGRRGRVV